jgi:hypothetical protein
MDVMGQRDLRDQEEEEGIRVQQDLKEELVQQEEQVHHRQVQLDPLEQQEAQVSQDRLDPRQLLDQQDQRVFKV